MNDASLIECGVVRGNVLNSVLGRLAVRNACARSAPERPRKTQLVAVRVGDVKEALAPFCVARRRLRPESSRDEPGIEAIDIVVVKNRATPPRPIPVRGLHDQVEKIRPRAETGETRILAAIEQL